ncbi:MAG: hypothetical protein QF535_20840 [Anaerolineales bacterium]|jgi:hypothetical protein|nr:hypothetical protein [Anaerolineales bacterium]|tara:strand:+ start:60 stop:338 length:279 start_codon:yes stop_codon:yes gene_type:complete
MTVLEIMERAGADSTNLTVAWIKDAVNMIQSNTKHDLKVKKMALTKNTRDYDLPSDLMSIDSVSLLDTQDDNKYKIISRMVSTPIVSEDTNP